MKYWIFTGAFFITGYCLQAQPLTAHTEETVAADTLLEVVVSASRHPEKVFSTPFSVSGMAMPMQEMHNARTLPEALMYLPGVFVQKTNHGGGSPFLRGLTGNQTLLMIDGIRVNNSTFRFGPNQYPNLVDAYTLQRVEVLKGSGSVQYGSDALGGVIHAITNDVRIEGGKEWTGNTGARIISQDMEYTARAELSYSSNGFGITGGYTWRQFGDLYGGDTTGRQTPSGYDERNWNLKAKWVIGKNLTLTASAQQVNQVDIPLYHRMQLENFEYYFFDPQKLLISYARLEGVTKGKYLKGWSITPLYKRSVEGRSYHRNSNVNYFSERDEVDSYGVVAETSLDFGKLWTSGTGVEYYYDKVGSSRVRSTTISETVTRGLYPDGSSQVNASLYSLHHLEWRQWKAELGIRYNFVENRIPGKNLDLPGTIFPDAELSTGALVGNASLLYKLGARQVIFANASSGFRAPGIDDLGTLGLVDFRYEIPSYDLEPEKNINTEVGYRFRGRNIHLQGSVFYMHLSDLISRVRKGIDSLEGYPVFIKTNDQEAYIRGWEFSGSYEPVQGLTLNAMASGQYGHNITRNEPLRRIPPINGLVGIRYGDQRWYLAAEMQWASKQDRLAQGDKDDNRIPAGGTPAWQVLNLHGGYLTPMVQLRATLSNLLNEDYRTHGSGIHGMGRAFTLSALFHFSTKGD